MCKYFFLDILWSLCKFYIKYKKRFVFLEFYYYIMYYFVIVCFMLYYNIIIKYLIFKKILKEYVFFYKRMFMIIIVLFYINLVKVNGFVFYWFNNVINIYC